MRLSIGPLAAVLAATFLAGPVAAAAPAHERFFTEAHIDVQVDCGDFVIRGDYPVVRVHIATFSETGGNVIRVLSEFFWDGRFSNSSDPAKWVVDKGHFVIEDRWESDGTYLGATINGSRGPGFAGRDAFHLVLDGEGNTLRYVGHEPRIPQGRDDPLCALLR